MCSSCEKEASFTRFILMSRGKAFLYSCCRSKSYERTGLAFKSERYGRSQGVSVLMPRVRRRRHSLISFCPYVAGSGVVSLLFWFELREDRVGF